jgi:hypothetical protein
LAPEYRQAFHRERTGCFVSASTMECFDFHTGQQIILGETG